MLWLLPLTAGLSCIYVCSTCGPALGRPGVLLGSTCGSLVFGLESSCGPLARVHLGVHLGSTSLDGVLNQTLVLHPQAGQ